MTPDVAISSLTTDELNRLTDEELDFYERSLELQDQIKTPLSYMLSVSSDAVDYPHIRVLEDYVLALIEHRLYPTGIGPQAIREGADVWINPDTDEETCQFLAITMPPRHGKQVDADTPVITPKGWVRHDDLKKGDYVYHPSGEPVRVKKVHPSFPQNMQVTLSDGNSVKVHANHEWTVFDQFEKKWRTLETKEIANMLYNTEAVPGYERCRFQLPPVSALDFPKKNLELDPYTLGVLASGGDYDEIPSDYLLSSESQRRALLSALVDFSGEVSPRGKTTVTFRSEGMMLSTTELVRSLGYRPIAQPERHNVYKVKWTPHDGKGQGGLQLQTAPQTFTPPKLTISSVKTVQKSMGNCITVGSRDGLYLVGKSLIPTHNSFYVSWHLPAWYLTNFPDREIILATHETEFSEEWSDAARTLVKAHPEYGVWVDPKNDSKARWKLLGRRGTLRCAGAGGSISGKPAHLLIGDDLIKNSEQAYSKTFREKLWLWYKTTWKTRREPDGVGIAMFTRWHEDDFIGRAIQMEKGEWFLLNLPALAFSTQDDQGFSVDPDTGQRDLLNRRPNEALCPERYSDKSLLRIKAGKDQADDGIEGGERVFTAMFQGKPSLDDGGLVRRPFSRYRYIDEFTYELYNSDGFQKSVKESDCWRFATVDLAATLKERADFTVLSIWDATPTGELIWRDCYRTKIESSEHVDFLHAHIPFFQDPSVKLVGVENVTYGLTLIQSIRKQSRKIAMFGVKTDRDKYARATPFGIAVGEGTIFFPEGSWPSSPFHDQCELSVAEEELLKCPNAAHDDIVDTCSIAMEMWKMAPRIRAKSSGDRSAEGRAHRNLLAHKKRRIRHGRLGQ